MTITAHTLSIQVSGKDVLAFRGRRHDDGSAFIDAHVPGHTIRAEWSTDGAAQASADGTTVKVSVDGGAVESLTLSKSMLMGPAGPWEPALEGGLRLPVTSLIEDAAAKGGGGGSGSGNSFQGLGATAGAAVGAAVGGGVGATVGAAVGALVGAILDRIFTKE